MHDHMLPLTVEYMTLEQSNLYITLNHKLTGLVY